MTVSVPLPWLRRWPWMRETNPIFAALRTRTANQAHGMPSRLVAVVLTLALSCAPVAAESRGWLFVSLLQEKTIVTFERNVDSGELTRRGQTSCPAEPACLAASPDQKTLFASFRSSGQVASFGIDPDSGRLSLLSVVEGGDDAAYLLSDRRGRFLLSAYYQSNRVAVHELGRDGAIVSAALQMVPTAENAHGLTLDSANRIAFVPHTGANRIYQFRFDEQSGRLAAGEPPFIDTPNEDHPRHIALHPSDRWAYVSNEAGDSLGVFEVDAGRLRRVQTLSTLPGDFDGSRNSTARCEMTGDGRFVYVANRCHDSIACFAINHATGHVRSLGQMPTEKTPRSFTIDAQFTLPAKAAAASLPSGLKTTAR